MRAPNTPHLLLLAPLMPAGTGNGLAMRAGLQLQALGARYDVQLVVVPVAGGSLDTAWAERHAASISVVEPGDDAARLAGAAHLVGSPAWRERLQRAQPLPHAATYASPALAAAVSATGATQGARVHAIRAYLAPLAVAVAEKAGAPWATLDLDDDDEHLLESEGLHDEARAYGRLLETFGPSFRMLSLASAEDAERVARRHGLPTTVLPNAVKVRSTWTGRSRRQADRRSLLLVGNLTYGPNVEAAEVLVREVLPRVRGLTDESAAVDLVGRFEPGGAVEALAALDGVALQGFVADLEDAYARADVAVVPLAHGSGTRIKLLEALEAGVPVVTTAVGAAGLDAEPGRHLLVGADARELAAAVARVLLDEELAAALAREGRALVAERFDSALVARRLGDRMTGLDASGDEPAGEQV